MASYNYGSGLTDISANLVKADYIVTPSLESDTFSIDFNNNDLSNVGLIDGYNLTTFNTRIIYSSNTAYYGSNTAYYGSNTAVWASNTAIYGSNTAVWASNTAIYGSNTAFWGSNSAYYGSNTATWASNNLVKNGLTVSVSNLSVMSNISTNSLSYKGSNVLDTDGKIDWKYLKNAPAFSNDNTLAIAGLTLGALGLATASGQMLTTTGMGQVLRNDINNKLGGDSTDEGFDPTLSDSNMYTHWNNLTYRPLYQNLGGKEIGFGSNVLIENNSKIYGINKADLIDVDGGKYRRVTSPASSRIATVFYDFSNQQLNCKTIYGSCNIYSSNINTSNIYSSNVSVSSSVTTSNISTSNILCQTFSISSNGIWANINNPLISQQMFDANGAFKGTVTKAQITDLEALDMGKLADGMLSWTGFSSTTAPSIFDPFVAVTSPLYEIV
jgi:hypothetical protein